jgi:hypothetical protein
LDDLAVDSAAEHLQCRRRYIGADDFVATLFEELRKCSLSCADIENSVTRIRFEKEAQQKPLPELVTRTDEVRR